MSDFNDECYFCEGKGYFECCPVEMGDNSPEGHRSCAFCGGDFYQEHICPHCDGSGKL